MDVVNRDRTTIADNEHTPSFDILEWAGRSPRTETRRNAVIAWMAVAGAARDDSRPDYVLKELVTAVLSEFKPGEVDREFLEFSAEQISGLQPALRQSVTDMVISRVTEGTVDARRAAILGQLLALQGGLRGQGRAYFAALSFSLRLFPFIVRDSFVPLFFLAGVACLIMLLLNEKMAAAARLVTRNDPSELLRAFYCSLAVGLAVAIFTVPRPLLPSRRLLVANAVVTSLAVGITALIVFFLAPGSANPLNTQALAAVALAASVFLSCLIALWRPIYNNPIRALFSGFFGFGGWTLVIAWGLAAIMFKTGLASSVIVDSRITIDNPLSRYVVKSVDQSATIFTVLLALPVAMAAQALRDASVLMADRRPDQSSRDPQSMERRWVRLIPTAGWLAATTLLAWNVLIVHKGVQAEARDFKKTVQQFWEIRPQGEPLSLDCNLGSQSKNFPPIAPGRYYPLPVCEKHYTSVSFTALGEKSNTEPGGAFLEKAGLVIIDQDFLKLYRDVGNPAVRNSSAPGRPTFVCFFEIEDEDQCPYLDEERIYLTEAIFNLFVLTSKAPRFFLRTTTSHP
jgi:hypothetical protein